MCCDSKPLVNDVISVIDSFNLTQWVNAPTHKKGHTLALVLSHSVNICIEVICSTLISDHAPVLFTLSLPHSETKPCVPARYCCATAVLPPCSRLTFNSLTAMPFLNACNPSVPSLARGDSFHMSVDEISYLFNSICNAISIAPSSKSGSEPWLNETTCGLGLE